MALGKCKLGHVISSVTSTVTFSHFAPFTDLRSSKFFNFFLMIGINLARGNF